MGQRIPQVSHPDAGAAIDRLRTRRRRALRRSRPHRCVPHDDPHLLVPRVQALLALSYGDVAHGGSAAWLDGRLTGAGHAGATTASSKLLRPTVNKVHSLD
jgi:hypothetical protein